MLKLYYAPGTVALAAHIALAEAGAAYEAIKLDFTKAEQREAGYLAVNPKGRVPALVTERGILTETPALLTYIAQTYPQAGLAPASDPFEFARMQSFMAYLCSTMHVAHAHKMRGARWANQDSSFEDMRSKVAVNMSDCCALIEHDYLDGPFVLGARYSLADPYLFTIAGWLAKDGVDVAAFPKIAAHMDMMRARPAVQRALAEQGPDPRAAVKA